MIRVKMNNAKNPFLYVVITIDVESSDSPNAIKNNDLLTTMIYGEVGGAQWGFPKILEILARYHLNATFFISAFEHKKYGESALHNICTEIKKEAQDIQLHVHPVWAYGKRYMAEYSPGEQVEIIKEGSRLLTSWTGEKPLAYRGGAYYSLNENTFDALKASGIVIDSTMFYSQPHCQYVTTRNRVVETKGIVELPVTIFRRQLDISVGPFKYKRQPRYTKTDIDGASLEALLQFVKEAKMNNLRVMNLFMHSYSFLNFDTSFSNSRPDYEDMEKFDSFLSAISSDPEIQIITMIQFYELYLKNPEVFTGASDYVPEIKTRLNTVTLFQQGWRYFKAVRTKAV
jgi:peptidoglycan/xylan/chitin deacetylase (PgdA/CDA1 family)